MGLLYYVSKGYSQCDKAIFDHYIDKFGIIPLTSNEACEKSFESDDVLIAPVHIISGDRFIWHAYNELDESYSLDNEPEIIFIYRSNFKKGEIPVLGVIEEYCLNTPEGEYAIIGRPDAASLDLLNVLMEVDVEFNPTTPETKNISTFEKLFNMIRILENL